MSESRLRTLALATGGGLTLGLLGGYAVAGLRGRSGLVVSVAYNVPIAFLFLTLGGDLSLRAVTSPLRGFVAAHRVVLCLWAVGALLLVLRLGAKSIEVSGHLTWLPLLTAQAWVYSYPGWFVLVAIASTVAALVMKVILFGGPSWLPGILAGSVLGAVLLASRPRGNAGERAG